MGEIIKIERMSYGPAAIGHLENGKTVFVEGAVPGDAAEIEIMQEKPRFATAKAVRIVSSSGERANAGQGACRGVNRGIGQGAGQSVPVPGAPWANIRYSAQLEYKQANLIDALIRVGHFERNRICEITKPCLPSKHEWGYRNKIELAAYRNESGKLTLGMHEQGADEVIPVDVQPLAHTRIQKAPKALTGALRYLQGSDDLGIFRIGIRESVRTESLEVALWTEPSAFPRKAVARTLQDALGATSIVRVLSTPGKARKVKKVEVLDGAGFWKEEFADASFAVSAPSFFQVNTQQAENLVNSALQSICVQEGMYVADLYCGVGTFSIPLALAGADVVAIESAGSSVRDLRRNMEFNGVDFDIVGDDVARVLSGFGSFDAIIVDPPRAGLEKTVVQQIANCKPVVLVYVSCDPQTFARDASRLEDAGLRLDSATPVDMFPQTYHCETIGVFLPK